ncbi:hypothetical protein K1719_001475 [Acacia pycnantha]|nr:hypothetical protein K1719_001475 [Acacia pycnantha]
MSSPVTNLELKLIIYIHIYVQRKKVQEKLLPMQTWSTQHCWRHILSQCLPLENILILFLYCNSTASKREIKHVGYWIGEPHMSDKKESGGTQRMMRVMMPQEQALRLLNSASFQSHFEIVQNMPLQLPYYLHLIWWDSENDESHDGPGTSSKTLEFRKLSKSL